MHSQNFSSRHCIISATPVQFSWLQVKSSVCQICIAPEPRAQPETLSRKSAALMLSDRVSLYDARWRLLLNVPNIHHKRNHAFMSSTWTVVEKHIWGRCCAARLKFWVLCHVWAVRQVCLSSTFKCQLVNFLNAIKLRHTADHSTVDSAQM